MRNLFFVMGLLAVFATGVASGCLVTWVWSHGSTNAARSRTPPLSAILKLATTAIPPERDHCDARLGHTVGEVLGGILEAGLRDIRNPYAYDCQDGSCRFEIGNCKPWQRSECGQTILEFQVDAHAAPRPDTFSCLDIP
jgi:hypothetical protein